MLRTARFLPLLVLSLAAALVAPLAAQENLFIQIPQPAFPDDKSRVEVEALFSVPPPSGFLPVRVEAINQRERAQILRLSTRAIHSSSGSENSEMVSSFEIESLPQSSATHDRLVPVATHFDSSSGYGGQNFQIELGSGLGAATGGLSGGFNPSGPAILLSESLHTPNAGALDSALNSLLSSSTISGSRHGSSTFAARYTPAKMPADWRAYSGYDVLIATDQDWLAMGPGVRNAILQWCRLGREIVIYRLGESQARFAALGIETAAEGDRIDYGLGSIDLARVNAARDLDAAATVGRFHASPEIPPLVPSINRDFSTNWPLHEKFGAQDFEYALFVVVLIAFGILVGPVNLFVFAKSGQRHKLFITTPVISIATSAVLIVLILFKDGIGGHGMIVSLIEVRPDAGENRAYLIQEQISRTGVLLGGSFELDEAAAITPVPLAPGDWTRLTTDDGGAGMRFRAEFEGERLSLAGDWFKSRSEQGQMLQAVVPTRSRIELNSQAGPPVLTSTFNHDISTLYYADANEGFWRAEDLATGTAVTCVPISADQYRAAVETQAARLAARQADLLRRAAARPGHFFAVTTAAPPVRTDPSIRWKEHTAIITGPPAR